MKLPAWKIFLALALTCALLSEFFQHVVKRSASGQVDYAQQQVLKLEAEMKHSLETIATFKTDSEFHEFFIHTGQQSKGFSFFYFESGTLRYWSDNEATLPDDAGTANSLNGSTLNLPNGIYEVLSKEEGNKKIVGLILFYRNFSYENKYLVNRFNPLLGLDAQFHPAIDKGTYRLQSSNGTALVSLDYSHIIPDELPFKLPAAFYLAAFFFLVSGIVLLSQNRSVSPVQLVITGVLLFMLRWMMIAFRLPGEMYYNDFFRPKVYGSSFFFNSIGDFLLNAFTLLGFTGILYAHRKTLFQNRQKVIFLPLVAALLVTLFYSIHLLIADLVLNSKIIFDTTISGISAYTFAGLLAVMLLLWSFYFIAAGLLFPFGKLFSRWPTSRRLTAFQSGLLSLVVLSAYASFVIEKNVVERKVENQKLFARRLDSGRDLLAEYLYGDVQKGISADPVLQKIIREGNDVKEKIQDHLQQNYFNGYFSKFDATISVFSNAVPADSDNSITAMQEQFARGKRTTSDNLVLLQDESGRLRYLSLLPVVDSSGGAAANIAVFLDPRSTQASEGFPELLVSNSVTASPDETNYSYARYTGGSLMYAGGNFSYPFNPSAFESSTAEFSKTTLDDYVHVIYRPATSSLIVVSRPSENMVDLLTYFSYILLFFLFIYLAAYLFFYFLQSRNRLQFSLKQRIRSSIIALVVISFVLIAAGTSIYIVRKYDSDKNKNILSRLNATWFALTDQLTFDRGLSVAGKNEFTSELNKIASTFNIDFNLYDENGNLFYSSQPKLFDRGVLSKRINPEALFEMQQYGHTQFVHAESIGKLRYAAAYAPLTGRPGNIAGYLNLPYFEKQNELNKEISGFLSALINIYMLLLLISLVLALLITSRITRPLLLIQEKLSSIRLGSSNEMIEYKRNDEIGQLVREYNRMVSELAASADKLARSEREGAWREMARQVAHEIKNPLTPMKLSIQHLQRAWNEKSGNLDELFQRISKTIIEQIDALSNIASEFSNFAMMPRTRNEILVLSEVLHSSINLFNDTPNVSIHYNDDGAERKVFADHEQLVRVFSNLIKNAVQSIPGNKQGIINISVTTGDDYYMVSVTDNGTGIPAAFHSKIFTPNFTTKTSGMGLGLAMVKSTVEAAGGSITFETAEGKGTEFRISIPRYHTDR